MSAVHTSAVKSTTPATVPDNTFVSRRSPDRDGDRRPRAASSPAWSTGSRRCSPATPITALRISLGLVFLGFGVLKFFPGMSPAAELAERTIGALTLRARRTDARRCS